MFKVIKKDTYEKLLNLVNNTVPALELQVEVAEQECSRAADEIRELKKQIETLSSKSDDNYVKIQFSNDLFKVIPIIGYREDVFEALFQEGLLNDGDNNPHAIQLALLTMVSDALQQLLQAFEEPLVED